MFTGCNDGEAIALSTELIHGDNLTFEQNIILNSYKNCAVITCSSASLEEMVFSPKTLRKLADELEEFLKEKC